MKWNGGPTRTEDCFLSPSVQRRREWLTHCQTRPSYSQAQTKLCWIIYVGQSLWSMMYRRILQGYTDREGEHMDWMPVQPSPISSWTRTKIWKLDINFVCVYVYVMALTGSTSAAFPGCSHLQSWIDCNMQIWRGKATPDVCLLSVHLTPLVNLFLHFFLLVNVL